MVCANRVVRSNDLETRKHGSVRYRADHQNGNALTIHISYPITRMDQCIESIGYSKVFSTVGFYDGILWMKILENDVDKMSFCLLSCIIKDHPLASSTWHWARKTSTRKECHPLLCQKGDCFGVLGQHTSLLICSRSGNVADIDGALWI